MTRIDRYLITGFLQNLSWAILAFWAVFIIINLVEHLDKFIDKGVAAKHIALYYVYYSPYIIILIAPMAVLLATLFAVGFLSKNNELLAMRAAGLSLWRLSFPFLAMGLLITGALFTLGETVYPGFEITRAAMRQKYIKGRAAPSAMILRGLYVPGGGGRVYHFQTFNTKQQSGTDVTVQTLRAGRLVESVRLSKLVYRDSVWIGLEGSRRIFSATGDSLTLYENIDSLAFPEWTETPEDIIRKRVYSSQMRYSELKSAIARLRRTGSDPAKQETELALKIAFPFINFIVILIGFPIASRAKQSGVALNFGLAMLITFIVRVLYEIFRSLGHSGAIEPLLAAWAPNLIALSFGIVVLLRVRK